MAFNLPKSPFNIIDPTGKTLSQVKSGEYTDIRDYTPSEMKEQIKSTGKSSAIIKSEIKKYRQSASKQRQNSSNVVPSSSNQMATIFKQGGARGEQGIKEAAEKMAKGTLARKKKA